MRAGSIFAVLSSLICACESKPSQPRPGAPAVPSQLVAPEHAAPSRTASSSRAAASAVRSIRETILPIVPPTISAQRLVFGKGMLGELRADRLLIRSTSEPERRTEVEVSEPRALISLPSGSLLALSADATYRFDPGAKKPHVYGHVVFFPDSELFPERANDRFFWVVHRSSRSACRYELSRAETPVLLADVEIPLPGFDGRAIAVHRDGDFVYSTETGLARLVPRGRVTEIDRPSGSSGQKPWRLLSAERLDRLWVVSAEGEVELWQFGRPASLVRKFRVAGTPYEAAATSSGLVLVAVVQGAGQPRRFFVFAYDLQGQQRLSHELPGDPPTADENWLSVVTRNLNLAVSEAEAKLAVGGPARLFVWDLKSGAKLPWP